MNSIIEEIQKALTAQRFHEECLVRDFRLVKVILPSYVMRELEKRINVIEPNIDPVKGFKVTMLSVPVEEDKTATRIRYVIEGDIKIL